VIASKSAGFRSVWGSAKIADEFNVKNEVYKEAQDVPTYIDGVPCRSKLPGNSPAIPGHRL